MFKVLVIEDERMTAKVVEYRLLKDGYQVVLAIDGKDGIEKIASENPDLIITDIMMPYYSGLEVVSHTRVTLGMSTPILMLSSMGLEKIVLDAFELGADDFVTKPFSPQELSIRVKKALIRR